MALRPHLWAMDDAPVNTSTEALILIALADEAADDGTGACPYIPKLMQRGRCSERTVQNTLRSLFQARLINNGDPRVAMRRYGKGAGQAPRCWDLNLEATAENVPTPRTADDMKAEYSAMIGIRVAPERPTADVVDETPQAEVQNLHPSPDLGKQAGVQDLHPSREVQPAAPQRCNGLHPRGATGCTLPACDLSVPENPPTPQAEGPAPAPADVEAEERGETAQPPNLNDVVDAAVSVREGAAGWSVSAVRRAIREAQGDGWSDPLIIEGVAALAVDFPRPGYAGTQYPSRLRHWLAAEARKESPAAADAETLPPTYGVSAYRSGRDQCKTHPGYPGDSCTACATDALVAEREQERERARVETDRAPALTSEAGEKARAAARAAALAAARCKPIGSPRPPADAQPASTPAAYAATAAQLATA